MNKSWKILLLVLFVIIILGIFYYIVLVKNRNLENTTTNQKTVKLEDISFNISNNYEVIQKNDAWMPKGLDEIISIESPNGKAIIYIGTKKPVDSIYNWENNECKSDTFCWGFDAKDLKKDKFDEHYWYMKSGANWDNIRIGDVLVMINYPYIQGKIKDQEKLKEIIINSLKLNNQ